MGSVDPPARLRPKVAIVGAGPVGLETARVLTAEGLDVRVYEAGDGPGAALARWRHVRLFTPWHMNVAEGALEDLAAEGLAPELDEDACPTIGSFVDDYLGALARHPRIAPTLRFGHRLVSAGRSRSLRFDLPMMPQRADSPFRLLLRGGDGQERVAGADVLVDCTGMTSRPAWIGRGGIPAPGERELRDSRRIWGRLPDLRGVHRDQFRARRVLLVGSGFSAATAAAELAAIHAEDPDTRIDWAIRHEDGPPIAPTPGDSLETRARLVEAANASVEPDGPIRLHRGAWVERLTAARDGVLEITLTGGARTVYDELLGMVGFVPDFSMLEGLQVDLDYATQGPRKLARILRKADEAGARRRGASPSWMHERPVGPDAIMSPEPDLFVLGHKSFGNRSDFFLQAGYLQARLVAEAIHWKVIA